MLGVVSNSRAQNKAFVSGFRLAGRCNFPRLLRCAAEHGSSREASSSARAQRICKGSEARVSPAKMVQQSSAGRAYRLAPLLPAMARLRSHFLRETTPTNGKDIHNRPSLEVSYCPTIPCDPFGKAQSVSARRQVPCKCFRHVILRGELITALAYETTADDRNGECTGRA